MASRHRTPGENEEMVASFASLEKVFEQLAECLFDEARKSCEEQRQKKLELAVAPHRGDSITDLLVVSCKRMRPAGVCVPIKRKRAISLATERARACSCSLALTMRRVICQRITDAEKENLCITERSDQELQQLRDKYLFIAQEAGHTAQHFQSSRRTCSQALECCLLELSMLMKARGEMMRVLRDLGHHGSMPDVRDHICALQTCAEQMSDPSSLQTLLAQVNLSPSLDPIALSAFQPRHPWCSGHTDTTLPRRSIGCYPPRAHRPL